MSKLTSLFRLAFAVLLGGAGLGLLGLTLAVLLGGAGPGVNSAWDKGRAAYQKGDYATALRAWQPLAEQGHVTAQNVLGMIYDEGQGVPEDDKAAAQWFRRAAEQGHARAQFNLGVLYENGKGVPRDDKIALQWFRRAAEQGQGHAQFNLSRMYYDGKGAPQDYIYAHMWFNIAASGGEKDLVELQNLIKKDFFIEEKMTPSQVAEAKKLARECVRKAYKDC